MEAATSQGLADALDAADLIVIGSGLFGLTIAERAASKAGVRVLILERRQHVGGNAYSYVEPSSGIEVHKYGSHLFHTSNPRVWDYISRFTKFNDYRHTVKSIHDGRVYSLPINLTTICEFLGRYVSPAEAKEWVRHNATGVDPSNASNFEERAITLVGLPLYEAFIKGYTQKQWQTDPKDLPAEIISRLPVRYEFNDRYFGDRWEGLPLAGYTKWLTKMSEHPLIEVRTGVNFHDVRHLLPDGIPLVYTGALDEYFAFSAGALTWRTLDFETVVLDVDDFQGTSVMNYADINVPFTRIHEFRHLHPERVTIPGKTVIMKEFSRFANRGDEPFYPVNSPSDRVMLMKYRELARVEENVVFGGRLGSYQYLDMHMAVASALGAFDREVEPLLSRASRLNR